MANQNSYALTWAQAQRARSLHVDKGVTLKGVAEKFGVSTTVIFKAVHRVHPYDKPFRQTRRSPEMPVSKYTHRRIRPAEFWRLLKAAGYTMRDFLFITGRRAEAVQRFLDDHPKADYVPTMSDVLLLELAGRHPETREQMMDIVNEYNLNALPAPRQAPVIVERKALR